MEVSIEIDGLKEMDKALRDLGADLGSKTLRNALRDAAKPLHQEMLTGVPVSSGPVRSITTGTGKKVEIRPGFLRARTKIRTSINKKGMASRRFKKDDVAVVKVGVFKVGYVAQVEYGTTKAKAQPFIRPALKRSDQALAIFKERLAKRIEMARKKVNRK